jgi:hypothetical protein
MFYRYAPFITWINPFQSFNVLKGYRVVLALRVVEAIQFNRQLKATEVLEIR